MVKDKRILEHFDKLYRKQKHYSYAKRLKIFDALLKEAIHLKKIPLKDPLEGIEPCLNIARILNLENKNSRKNRRIIKKANEH